MLVINMYGKLFEFCVQIPNFASKKDLRGLMMILHRLPLLQREDAAVLRCLLIVSCLCFGRVDLRRDLISLGTSIATRLTQNI